MTTTKQFNVKSAFENYKSTALSVSSDLSFWKSFLDWSIKRYQEQEIKPKEIYSAMFAAYNVSSKTGLAYAVGFEGNEVSIKTTDLEEHRANLFSWVMNLSILKIYNVMEIFLLQGIWLKYFPHLNNPTRSKRDNDTLINEIRNFLKAAQVPVDAKNNRYLIEFMKLNSPAFKDFADGRTIWYPDITWAQYFELTSIIRNIVAHKGTHISSDTLNEMKSKYRTAFEAQYEVVQDGDGERHIRPFENQITGIFDLMNDFSINAIKFINDEKDFSFLEGYSAIVSN